jgi:hypothetical protein
VSAAVVSRSSETWSTYPTLMARLRWEIEVDDDGKEKEKEQGGRKREIRKNRYGH